MIVMHYLGRQDFSRIFEIVYKHYTGRESAPDYFSEEEGLRKLEGVLEGVKMDRFYPDFYDKVAYLLIQINTHYFSNGNKRLALVCVLAFILINNYEIFSFSKDKYKAKLEELFPKFRDFHDYEDFLPEEFGYYNLSIVVADNKKYTDSFEELKTRIKSFFQFSVNKKSP